MGCSQWAVFIKLLSPDSGIYPEEEAEVVGDTEETASSSHNRTNRYNSETVAACTGPAQVQTRQNPGVEKRKRTQSPTANQEAIWS